MIENFVHLRGGKRNGMAALCGLLGALALPPAYMLPLLVPSFSGLLLLLWHAPRACRAFADGWWWGMGYFTAGLYWICISLYVEPEKFAWLTPFALFGLPSILGIYTGITTLAVWRVRGMFRRMPFMLPAAFATAFVAVEIARTYWFSGFPWNLIGYVWTVSDITLQSAWLVGVYGLGWVAVFAGSAPALFFFCKNALPVCVVALLLLGCMTTFGIYRLDRHPTVYSAVKVRVVQPDIPQDIKWSASARRDILEQLMKLSAQPENGRAKLVVWPEAAIPYNVELDSPLLRDIASVLPPGAFLLAGGLHAIAQPDGGWQAWNSLFAVDAQGRMAAVYDKHHLVPFGEYIPFRRWLPLENISGGHGDFSGGNGAQTLNLPEVPPFSPLICYEAIFPGEATDHARTARWLLNVTNDAWFGLSTGPYQHLQMARMRAVENGLPLVRAANTGISAVFDPYGRMLVRLGLLQKGTLDFYLPESIFIAK